ncbi:MAG: tetraacyldisaccharide 4'-kinase [Bdellovibrionota bacterium]
MQKILIRFFLWCLSWVYMLAVFVRKLSYKTRLKKTYQLPGITISVGNIAVGGTGKSPIVIELARYLIEQGHRPAVLTRGYKSGIKPEEFAILRNGSIQNSNFGIRNIYADEAMMQSKELFDVPIIIGRRRYQAAMWYLDICKEKPTHWILDDGFQHLQVQRSVDIVLLDAVEPLSDEKLLPLGHLRESKKALCRADVIIFTRCKKSFPSDVMMAEVKNISQAPLFFVPFEYGELSLISLDQYDVLKQNPRAEIAVLVGVAKPDEVIDYLVAIGKNIRHVIKVSDHQRFPLLAVKERIAGCSAVVTTAKDYWREPEIFHKINIPTYILPLSLKTAKLCFSSIL